MSVRILFFASLREALGTSGEALDLPAGVDSVARLREHLVARGGVWAELGRAKGLRAAVNQRMCEPTEPIRDGDEIAFFPPVTGG